ncbi:hypothetical protein B0J18DRAFT_8284 [Chaetomium sp. MPI-SDFR-AT-0129]|nr:hypothetical protein B0J18DRAFT_8284 [Chaetomium sp. MPI-SDFR-AT-0129]
MGRRARLSPDQPSTRLSSVLCPGLRVCCATLPHYFGQSKPPHWLPGRPTVPIRPSDARIGATGDSRFSSHLGGRERNRVWRRLELVEPGQQPMEGLLSGNTGPATGQAVELLPASAPKISNQTTSSTSTFFSTPAPIEKNLEDEKKTARHQTPSHTGNAQPVAPPGADHNKLSLAGPLRAANELPRGCSPSARQLLRISFVPKGAAAAHFQLLQKEKAHSLPPCRRRSTHSPGFDIPPKHCAAHHQLVLLPCWATKRSTLTIIPLVSGWDFLSQAHGPKPSSFIYCVSASQGRTDDRPNCWQRVVDFATRLTCCGPQLQKLDCEPIGTNRDFGRTALSPPWFRFRARCVVPLLHYAFQRHLSVSGKDGFRPFYYQTQTRFLGCPRLNSSTKTAYMLSQSAPSLHFSPLLTPPSPVGWVGCCPHLLP